MLWMVEQLSREPATVAPTKRITKMGPDDDVEVYLEILERTANSGQPTSGATSWPGKPNGHTGTLNPTRRDITRHKRATLAS